MKSEKIKCAAEVYNIPQDLIDPNPEQPRRRFDFDELEGLAQSIRENGILQPITVKRSGEKRFELVSGERRLRAARLVGFSKIPAIVVDIDEKDSAVFSLLENLQRQGLDFFEEAEAIERLINDFSMSREDVARRLGLAQSTISRAGLSERHARALLTLPDDIQRARALSIIIDRRLNVAETERLIEQMISRSQKPKSAIKGIRDIRLFINTLNHAVDTIRRAGVDADTAKSETAEYIEYIVRIPKLEQLRISLPGDSGEAV